MNLDGGLFGFIELIVIIINHKNLLKNQKPNQYEPTASLKWQESHVYTVYAVCFHSRQQSTSFEWL